jgi:uncharacterized SAM-binding protein YcdF (DUF218 family)
MLAPLCGCAGWHDLFQRDHPDEALLAATLAAGRGGPADVALVLGCPARKGGGVSPCERCRVRAAVSAYQRGAAGALIFSGGAAHNRWVEGEVMARLARDKGVPAERALVEGQALTTWQNFRFSQRIMRAHGLRTALIISAADHLPRARRFADYYGIDVTGYLACDR